MITTGWFHINTVAHWVYSSSSSCNSSLLDELMNRLLMIKLIHWIITELLMNLWYCLIYSEILITVITWLELLWQMTHGCSGVFVWLIWLDINWYLKSSVASEHFSLIGSGGDSNVRKSRFGGKLIKCVRRLLDGIRTSSCVSVTTAEITTFQHWNNFFCRCWTESLCWTL